MVWQVPLNSERIASPGLLVDPDRVAGNIEVMLTMVGGASGAARLRPHVKTHKMPEVVRLQMAAGITEFKAATIAEARMVATAGGRDVLLAYQPVGPNIERLAGLVDEFPTTTFTAIVDDVGIAQQINARLGDTQRPFGLYIDVDCGMHRTGIPLGPELERLRDSIESKNGLEVAGLHVYDGHIHDPDESIRQQKAGQVITAVDDYQRARPVPNIIGGGSPTFPIWAKQTDWQCSPGTSLLWDFGYGNAHPEMDFSFAALLLTRVISKPGRDRLCLDLGHKAVAAEMPLEQRVLITLLHDAQFIGQSEEHLVLESSLAARFKVGDPVLACPKHICPTVALHAFATVVRDDRATGEVWPITARDR